MIDLSIIIPVYNASPLIERCLNSILMQSTSYNYEIICVDDGSTDNSLMLIKKFSKNNIHIIKQQNSGPATARNHGLQHSTGRYITYIDADDYIEDGYIQKCISFLEKNMECIAVSVSCKNINPLNKKVSYSPSWMSENMHQTGYLISDFFNEWSKNCFVGTCSTVIRRDIAIKSGGMRTDLRITEDYEYWNYLSTFGTWGFIPEVLYISDGADVTATQGWIKKMEKRWHNAPTISEWEKRIVKRLPTKLPLGYLRARGRVSRNLTYCQLLSDRLSLSRHEALRYGKYFIKDPIGRLMNIAKYTSFTWWMLAKLLKYREYHRKIS